DKKERVVGSGADQAHRAAFNIGKENILLGFVEAMNFIDEEDRGPAGVLQSVGSSREHSPHVSNVGFDSTEALKFARGLPCDELGEGGLAGAGRSVKDGRLKAICCDGGAGEVAGTAD